MIVRPLGTPLARHCHASLLLSSSTAAGNGVAAATAASSSLHVQSVPSNATTTALEARCFSTTNDNSGSSSSRTFSSLPPHHLARKNNGMINVLIKSTKVPRPVTMVVPPPPKPKPKPKQKQQQQPSPSNNNKAINKAKKNHHQNRQSKEERLAAVSEMKANALLHRELEEEEEHVPPSHFSYAGNASMPITAELNIVLPEDDVPTGIWPVFRMLDESGNFRHADDEARHVNSAAAHCSPPPPRGDLSELRSSLVSRHPHFAELFRSSDLLRHARVEYPDTMSDNTLLRAHRQMIRLRTMDTILHNAQRQGRISFYMTHHGEEAIHMGSASALRPQDHIFAQYREAGVLMWRGFTLEQFCNQCFSNDRDLGKGKQMPVHYGCRALNYQTVSSPLGTQITQAVGAAYKFKLDRIAHPERGEEAAAVAIVYFGDGAASTIDFHSACNFAATLKAPVIFFCRNNGYAISTPVEDQYAGDGIISRAPGYGMAGIRVDGNDIFAVHAAVAKARALAVKTSSPVMIEAMTYRGGHHSTSDDSSRYRDADEVREAEDVHDPIARLDRFLRHVGWVDENAVASIEDEERIDVLRAMEAAEKRPPPRIDVMFQDVYHEKPPHLLRQEEELMRHMKRHGIVHQ